MKPSLSLLFIFLFTNTILKAQGPSFNWARGFGGGANDYATNITTDSAGNVYSAGTFDGVVDFDPGPGTNILSAGPYLGGYITKFDSLGNLIWAKVFQGSFVSINSIKVDAVGNVYTTGHFVSADFDPGPGTYTVISFQSGYVDAFVCKLNSSGNFIWAKKVGGPLDDAASSIALDNNGSLYFSGTFKATADFDPSASSFTVASWWNTSDAFLCKFDTAGNFIWVQTMTGGGYEASSCVDIDYQGNILCTGTFDSGIQVTGAPSYSGWSMGNADVFVSKFNSAGTVMWFQTFGGSGLDLVNSVKVDQFGSAYVRGIFNDTVDFDPGPLLDKKSGGIYLSKFDLAGNYKWVNVFGGATGATASGGNVVDTDNKGNVYTIAGFYGTFDFDSGAGTYTMSSNDGEIFVAKLDSTGAFLWARNTATYSLGMGLVVDKSYNIYCTGFYYGPVDFHLHSPATDIHTSNGGPDIFIWRWNGKCQTPASPTVVAGSQTLCAGNTTTLLANGSGFLNWYSTLTSASAIGNGSIMVVPVLAQGTYSYYAEAFTCTQSPRNLFVVTVNPVPSVSVISNSNLLCSGESVVLTAVGASTYSWSNSNIGNPITVMPLTTTSFSLSGTDTSGCVGFANIILTVDPCVGMNRTDRDKLIIVSPNPTEGLFSINAGDETIHCQVFDSKSRLILENKCLGTVNFDLSDYSKGLYYVKISTTSDFRVIKVMKE